MANRTYTILGATGNIGRILVENLLKRGHKVKAIGRDQKKLRSLQQQGTQCFAGDITDLSLLLKASEGSDALFSFIPPETRGMSDFGAYQDQIGQVIFEAIQKNGIPYVLNLSSVGAELSENTGPIKGLHRHEKRLNTLSNVHILHFKPGFFMENLLLTIPMIEKQGLLGTTLRGDLSLPMIATKDIGEKGAELLDQLNFKGHQIFDFEGPQGITMIEATKTIGKKMGIPDLSYKQFPYDQAEASMIATGRNPSFVKLLIEMHKSFNENKIKPTQTITSEHKGRTTFEKFLKGINFSDLSLAI